MIPGQGAVVARVRSTKAGALTPATPRRLPSTRRPCRTLNEGRGSHPGDTATPSGGTRRPNPTLNEGRGSHPGDTRIFVGCVVRLSHAQRRPGLSPRRHLPAPTKSTVDPLRSTKAGALTPATRSTAGGRFASSRPRSTKAGALTPATRGKGKEVDVVDRRSTKAGALTPATLLAALLRLLIPGRSTKAGALTPATLLAALLRLLIPGRSTKAGALTPATPRRSGRSTCAITHPRSLNEGRGSHPGDTRPGKTGRWTGRKHDRSTKAGALTPATLRCSSPRQPWPYVAALNEGRGSHPGDTRGAGRLQRGQLAALNEGRGSHPGDT